jgi:hypothetical protein
MPALSYAGRRLFATVWLITAAAATTNVVRETYLAVALAERGTIRVDPYLGLNSDLFEIPGRGAFINGNPGASFLAALPYATARPLLEAIYRARPALVAPKPPTSYDDPRPNRTTYMNAMRERGLDVRLAAAALVIAFGLMAPAAALAALVLFRFLLPRGVGEPQAAGLALLYALGTPVLFRSAYLNQNVLLAHAVLFTWALLRWPGPEAERRRTLRWGGAGALLGAGVLCDYSATPLALVFATWAGVEGWKACGGRGAAARLAAMAAGAAPPVALLLAYQRAAFGNPFLPAQSWMPSTPLSIHGWHGMTLPSPDLLLAHLVDPEFGLFAFCPLLLLAFFDGSRRDLPGAPRREEAAFAFAGAAALWLFESANQYARMQFNSGVRYLLPAVPLLFLLAVPKLLALGRAARLAWIAPTLLVSAAVAMTREGVPRALVLLVTEGPTLPLLRTLQRTAGAYAPFLAHGLQPWGALSVALVGLLVALLCRNSGLLRRA